MFPLIVIGPAETHNRFGLTSEVGAEGVDVDVVVVSVDVVDEDVSPVVVVVSPDGVEDAAPPSFDEEVDDDVSPVVVV